MCLIKLYLIYNKAFTKFKKISIFFEKFLAYFLLKNEMLAFQVLTYKKASNES
jgi:hypothetical protein